MKFPDLNKNFYSTTNITLALFFSFAVWIFCFRDFLMGHLVMTSDAISYYDHTKFYLTRLATGVYPLWDPYWECGAPNDFFLSRIGAYNPFLLIAFILYKVGMPFIMAYQAFSASYYFLGLIGFYLLARKVIGDNRFAFLAYLLLMFSSLGTRLFDSYIVLVFVPTVWFFYFLFVFVEKRERYAFLGMTLTLLLILTTYIPFYFLTTVFFFIVCFAVFYFKKFKEILSQSFCFVRQNKVVVGLCALVLVLSVIPGIILFQDMSKPEVVMPFRHYNAPVTNSLTVTLKSISDWGIIEDIFYSTYFADLRTMSFSILYLPLFTFLVFFLGLFVKFEKRILLLLVWVFSFFLLCCSRSIQGFLYDHVFFFKFFKNFHFFLWIVLVPAFILLIVYQFYYFLTSPPQTRKGKVALWAFITVVHLVFLGVLIQQGYPIWANYLTVLLSYLFFGFHCSGLLKNQNKFLFWLFFGLVIIQPLQAYHYFSLNAEPPVKSFTYYRYDYFPTSFVFLRTSDTDFLTHETEFPHLKDAFGNVIPRFPRIYLSTYWYNRLFEGIFPDVFDDYVKYKFILYDSVEKMSDETLDLKRVEKVFKTRQNIAFVPGDYDARLTKNENRDEIPFAQLVAPQSDKIQVISFDANHLVLKTKFLSEKFLVYNDNYDSNWRASIDGNPVKLWRANIAFKGLWVPAGEHVIHFSYGVWWMYGLRILLFVLTILLLILVVSLWVRTSLSRKSI